MNRIIIFIIGIVSGTAVTTAVHHSHLVRTDENWIIVPRSGVTLKDAYADIRQWSVKEWREHPELMRDLVKAGRAEVIGSELTDRILDELTPEPRVSERDEPPSDWR